MNRLFELLATLFKSLGRKPPPQQYSELQAAEVKPEPYRMLIRREWVEAIRSPQCKYSADQIAIALSRQADRYRINNASRIACFLAQIGHESLGFSRNRENMYYSEQRLREVRSWPGMVTWRQRIRDDEIAQFSGQPEKLAERVYSGRMGNGPEGSGDAWHFRGAFWPQLTGKDNWLEFSRHAGIPLSQMLIDVESVTLNAQVSAWFFTVRANCLELADNYKFDEITRAIAGGYTDVEKRWQLCLRVLKAMRDYP